MADLFDPARFLAWPGTNGGVASPLPLRGPCSCGCVTKEVAVEVRVDRETGARREDVSLRCVECFRVRPGDKRPPAKILGWVDMVTGKATEAPSDVRDGRNG